MSPSHYVRVWQSVDAEGIQQHLVIVGELTGDCGHCRHVGIDYVKEKSCPQCGHPFRFITCRTAAGSMKGAMGAVRRIKERRPDLTFIDYNDYSHVIGSKKAHDFFK